HLASLGRRPDNGRCRLAGGSVALSLLCLHSGQILTAPGAAGRDLGRRRIGRRWRRFRGPWQVESLTLAVLFVDQLVAYRKPGLPILFGAREGLQPYIGDRRRDGIAQADALIDEVA